MFLSAVNSTFKPGRLCFGQQFAVGKPIPSLLYTEVLAPVKRKCRNNNELTQSGSGATAYKTLQAQLVSECISSILLISDEFVQIPPTN